MLRPMSIIWLLIFFFFNDTATTEIYTLSLHDALPIEPYSRTAICLFFVCSTFVIAAVKVVLPWSMCPIVPMFTCGFVRSYLALAIPLPPFARGDHCRPNLNSGAH